MDRPILEDQRISEWDIQKYLQCTRQKTMNQGQFLKMHIDFQCHIQSTHINIHLQKIHHCLETEKSLMQR